MSDIYKKKTGDIWENILHGKKLLTDKEAEQMEKTVLKIRKEYGFRI